MHTRFPRRPPLPILLPLLALALGAVAAGRAGAQSATLPERFAESVATTERAFPGLLRFSPRPSGPALTEVDKAQLDLLLDRLAAGEFPPEVDMALRVILEGFSRQPGPVGVEGRQIMQAAAGLAAESRRGPALRGMADLLGELMEDPGHPYSLLAQDLLSEMIRCGAASRGDEELVAAITARVNPDREGGVRSRDSTVADRYGLHRSADLYAVAADGARAVAVGELGSILVSGDGGESWRAPASGTDEALYAVALGPGRELWAVGRSGVVLHSVDGAVHFARRATPFARHLFGAIAPRAGAVRVVGDFGLQLATDDAGGRWRCIPRGEDVILGRIAWAGPDAALVGEFATVERLPGADFPGRPGQLAEGLPEDLYLFDLWFDAAGRVGVAVGLAGTVLRSEDGGEHWAPIASGLDADLYGVGGAGRRVVVAGEGGTIAVSEDAGLHFVRVDAPAGGVAPFFDVAFAGAGRALLVGSRGTIAVLDPGAPSRRVHPPAAAAPTR